jgi:hypothetical protein
MLDIIAIMPDPPHPPIVPLSTTPQRAPESDKMLCDRCGDEVYRMRAVWRCPACGFRTDCCGW